LCTRALTATLFTVANAVLLTFRLRVENAALASTSPQGPSERLHA